MMREDIEQSSYSVTGLEAYQVLHELASGKLGELPVDLIVRHVLHLSMGADWPVQRAALEAVIRRRTFARRDRLRVARRPRGLLGLGRYRTQKHGEELRPYTTLLASIDPLVGSCDCPDFQKSGLGLCKHLLVVLEDLVGKGGKWRRAMTAGLEPARRGPRLVWDPCCPLTGPADWLDRVSWWPGNPERPVPGVIARFFSRGRDGRWVLPEGAQEDEERRQPLVEALDELLRLPAEGRFPVGHDPVLVPLLGEERRRLALRADGRELVEELGTWMAELKHPLYAYQKEGLARFLGAGRLLLADDMGLGKTVQAIAACDVLWRSGRVRRGLLLVPAPLKSQWAREWTTFSGTPVRVVEGTPSRRASIYRDQREGFLIANYEQLFRDLHLMYRWAPEMIVLDEAQRIKNWATKTATYVKRLQPRYRLVLTGTPMENRLDELASVMEWVDERALEPKWRLAPWHMTLWDGEREAAGARNLDTLRLRLAGAVVRRVRKEVLDQLPPRTDIRVPVDLTDAQAAEHEDLVRPIAQLMQRAKKRPLTQAEFLRLMQLLATQRIICNGLAQARFDEVWPDLSEMDGNRETVLRSLDSPKLLEIRELVRQLVVEGGQKLVIFSQWRRMLQLAQWAVGDVLRDAGYRSAFFSGAESQSRRTQNIVEFHDDPTLAVLFSTDAGGVGLNLQRAASSVVNLELPWNPAVLEQRIGRVYRLGQRQPVQVFNLISEQGIEARIARIVDDKQALFSGLFDGTSDELRFSASNRFLDTMEKLVPPVEAPELGEVEEEDLDRVEVPVPASPRRAMEEPFGPEAAAPVNEEASRPAAAAVAAPSTVPDEVPHARSVQQMLSAIRVERTPEGGLRIEAPPEAATTLAAMFQGMADLMAAAAQGGGAEG